MGKIRPPIHHRFKSVEVLRAPLEKIIKQYDPAFLPTDPLKYAHRYANSNDREVVAFVSAILAFGNVKAIFGTLDKIFSILGKSPVQYLLQTDFTKKSTLQTIYHRWVTGEDLTRVFTQLKKVYSDEGTLESYFLNSKKRPLSSLMALFSNRMKAAIFQKQPKTRGLQFLFPSPTDGSACKRMNLFLRWVVRTEAPDLGIWKTIKPNELYLPIDVHLGRILSYIGLTRKKIVNWKMVEEVSEKLQYLYPEDPVRLDFALARLGILNFCKHKADPQICPNCPLHAHCRLFQNFLRKVA